MLEIYSKSPKTSDPPQSVEWPSPMFEAYRRPEGYLPDDGLVDAVNVALQLGRPLLVTGEPGTGKTLLASSLAWQLAKFPALTFASEPLRYEAKSSSTSKSLFYEFDTIGRFGDYQLGIKNKEPKDYLKFNALGIAILWASSDRTYSKLLDERHARANRARAVVLIDEIDKAPRDFPNDILNEIENFEFAIPELGARISADPDWRPVVVITSNSERQLPDAFLRRCIFYNIPFPEKGLADIVKSRLGALGLKETPNLERSMEFLGKLRKVSPTLQKKPSTAEFLNWLVVLDRITIPNIDLFQWNNIARLRATLPALLKTVDDLHRGQLLLDEWLASSKPK